MKQEQRGKLQTFSALIDVFCFGGVVIDNMRNFIIYCRRTIKCYLFGINKNHWSVAAEERRIFSSIRMCSISGCCTLISGGKVVSLLFRCCDLCTSLPLVSALRWNIHRAPSVPLLSIANVRKTPAAQPRCLSFRRLLSFAFQCETAATPLLLVNQRPWLITTENSPLDYFKGKWYTTSLINPSFPLLCPFLGEVTKEIRLRLKCDESMFKPKDESLNTVFTIGYYSGQTQTQW